jgi:hypothetical protein
MMFRVEWLQSALNDLAKVWLRTDTTQRQAITAASHNIEERLRRNAPHEGESRSAGRRIMFAAPLAVIFRVERDGVTISVLQVRMFRQRAR